MQIKANKRTWIIFAMLILASTILILSNREEYFEAPEELFGTWTTTNPLYADRYFKLSRDIIIYGLGAEGINVYNVLKIQGIREYDNIVYTVTFIDNDDIEYNQSLYFNHNDNTSLVFNNQVGIIWRKLSEHM